MKLSSCPKQKAHRRKTRAQESLSAIRSLSRGARENGKVKEWERLDLVANVLRNDDDAFPAAHPKQGTSSYGNQ
jgi:hypothetical protein